jgi:hypothetical protein
LSFKFIKGWRSIISFQHAKSHEFRGFMIELVWYGAFKGFVHRTDIMNLSIYYKVLQYCLLMFSDYPFSVLFGYVRVDLYHLLYFVGELDVAFERVDIVRLSYLL